MFQPFLRFWHIVGQAGVCQTRRAGCDVWFQPFLRFWVFIDAGASMVMLYYVSTLLEILALLTPRRSRSFSKCKRFQPFLRFWLAAAGTQPVEVLCHVSTLLEILGLVCLILVGF